jgi:hypothetical protein
MAKKFDPMDQSTEEKVQSPEDRQAPGYDNEVPINSWLRGGREDATRYACYDKSQKFFDLKKGK